MTSEYIPRYTDEGIPIIRTPTVEVFTRDANHPVNKSNFFSIDKILGKNQSALIYAINQSFAYLNIPRDPYDAYIMGFLSAIKLVKQQAQYNKLEEELGNGERFK
jgi:hypothetical protein